MDQLENIKDWYLKKLAAEGRTHLERSGISVSLLSGNDERHGTCNFFIHYQDKSALLKRWRHDDYGQDGIKRLKQLPRILKLQDHDTLAKHTILGALETINGVIYEYQPFIISQNGYQLIRSLTKGDSKRYIESALDYCKLLSQVTIDNDIMVQHGFGAEAEKNRRFVPIHNDFAPSNIIFDKTEYWVIDWEYYDTGPALFNYFDVIYHFGSLMQTSRIRRRNAGSYSAVFANIIASPSAIISRSVITALSDYKKVSGLGPEDATEILRQYLSYKGQVQLKIYGTSQGLDLFWQQVSGYSSQIERDFSQLWQQHLA